MTVTARKRRLHRVRAMASSGVMVPPTTTRAASTRPAGLELDQAREQGFVRGGGLDRRKQVRGIG